MTEILYILFYLGVLALVLGCVGYLVVSRSEATLEEAGYSLERVATLHPEAHIAREALKKAEALSGAYHLRDLEKILTELTALQAWGLIVDLGFPGIGDHAQMELQPEELDLYSHHSGRIPGYLDRFFQSAAKAGEIHPVPGAEDDFVLRILAPLPDSAAVALQVIKEIYGVTEETETNVRIFR